MMPWTEIRESRFRRNLETRACIGFPRMERCIMRLNLWRFFFLALAAAPAPVMAQNTIRIRIVNEYFAYTNATTTNYWISFRSF